MRVRITLLVLMAAVLALSSTPARAGGATFQFPLRYYAPGEEAVGEAIVWFPDERALSAALGRAPWRGYLTPVSEDPVTSGPPESGILLGTIEIERIHDQQLAATFRFTVPLVEPGTHEIRYCDRDCTSTMGDLIGGWFDVVASPLERRLLQRFDTAERHLYAEVRKLWGELDRRVDSAEEASVTRADLDGLTGRIRSLEAESAAQRGRGARVAAAGGGMAIALGLAGTVLWRLGRGIRERRELRLLLAPDDVPAKVVPFELEPL